MAALPAQMVDAAEKSVSASGDRRTIRGCRKTAARSSAASPRSMPTTRSGRSRSTHASMREGGNVEKLIGALAAVGALTDAAQEASACAALDR